MNQTFINLSAAQSKGLDKPLHENSQNLYKDALLIAEVNKSYSKATSLLVLSLEECIKAILVRLHSEGLKVYKIEGVQKFVGDHKIRHQVAQLIEMGAGLVEVYEKWEEGKSKPKKFKIEWLNIGKNSLQAVMQFHNSAKRIEKLKGFNNLKNNGFYVGFIDELLDPAVMITEEDYREVKNIKDRMTRFYRFVNYIYKPSSKGMPIDQRKEEVKGQLKFFVDEVLSDFSFKEFSKKNKK